MGHDNHSTPADNKPKAPFRAAFWLIVILAGLFVAAVNFITVMSHDDGGHGATSEHSAPAHGEQVDHSSTADEVTKHGDHDKVDEHATPATTDSVTATEEAHH
jgi:hypothetical protein